MKMLLVANAPNESKRAGLLNELQTQVENSLGLGWRPADLLVVTNFIFEYMGIRSFGFMMPAGCWSGSKMFAIQELFKNGMNETVWAHDLDCWQCAPFSEPLFRDVGICTYSTTKFNGGSVFWKPSALPIINEIVGIITKKEQNREEPTLNKVLKNEKFKDKVTVLDNTYNVGCSGFIPRLQRSEKPIKVVHFHPCNRLAWDTHVRDRNKLGESPVPDALLNLFIKRFPCIQKHIYPETERGYHGDWKRPDGVKHD